MSSGDINCGGNFNVVGDLSFNNLDLSSNSTWSPCGNFSYVANTNYGSSDNSRHEFGTICIGNIQIKFGYVPNNVTDNVSDAGFNTVNFTNPFPNNTLVATGSVYSDGTCNIYSYDLSWVTFTNGGYGNYIFWIAIGN